MVSQKLQGRLYSRLPTGHFILKDCAAFVAIYLVSRICRTENSPPESGRSSENESETGDNSSREISFGFQLSMTE
jgi:hypothetical protein